MQVGGVNSNTDVDREVLQAEMTKKQLQRQSSGDQQMIDSAMVEQPVKEPRKMIGVYLDTKA